VLAAAALGILLLGVWGVGAAIRVQALRQEIEIARRDVEALRAQAGKLTETIQRLRTDHAYIEKLAREQHGLVREDEEVLKFPPRPR
jgi:cell division protein FtsB